MKHAMKAVMGKDLRGITANRQLFSVILIVPVVLSVVLPLMFVLITHFAPQEMGDFEAMLRMLPGAEGESTQQRILHLLANYMMPMMFLLIPVMASSVMAANAFVGEKEKQTLETLLYSPMTLREIFIAKVMAAFWLSMLVSVASFALMVLVLEGSALLVTGQMVPLEGGWGLIMLLVSPALSMIAITLMVRTSAKAQNAMEAQQKAVFLVLPILLLMMGQFTGVMLLSNWLLLALGLAAAALAWLLIKRAMHSFTYERLLT